MDALASCEEGHFRDPTYAICGLLESISTMLELCSSGENVRVPSVRLGAVVGRSQTRRPAKPMLVGQGPWVGESGREDASLVASPWARTLSSIDEKLDRNCLSTLTQVARSTSLVSLPRSRW